MVDKGRERPIASRAKGLPLHSSGVNRRAPATPHINDEEQEQPDDVDKVPVPGSSFKTEVLTRCKVSLMRADQIDDQENGADQYVEDVKACRHVKGRAVCCADTIERCIRIFIDLEHRKNDTKQKEKEKA